MGLRKRIGVATAIALTSIAIGSTAALAAPHFHSASSSVGTNGALTVSFDERGLGNENVDYTLTADQEANWACINNGGRNPSAANKRTITTPVSTGGSFEVKNGRVVASLSTSAPSPGSFSCPSGQRLRLLSVSYTNIELTDVTNGESISVDDTSRTFFTL